MGNFVNPIGLNFDDEKLIRLDKDKFTKYFNFKMQQVTVTTDRGIVIRTKSDSYIDLSSFDMITLPYNPTAQKNLDVELVISTTDEHLLVIRVYLSLIEMLSKMGGISKVLLIVFGLLYLNYNERRLKQKILDGFVDSTDKSLPKAYLEEDTLKKFVRSSKNPEDQKYKLESRWFRSNNWIMKNGNDFERYRRVAREQSRSLVEQQMDFVDIVEQGILQDALYEAMYPMMFKTLIPIAYINMVKKGINKQKMLEKIKNENITPKVEGKLKTFVTRFFGAEEIEELTEEEQQKQIDINDLIDREKKGGIRSMNYEEAVKLLLEEETPADHRLQKIRNFLLTNLPSEFIGDKKISSHELKKEENTQRILRKFIGRFAVIRRKYLPKKKTSPPEVEVSVEKETNNVDNFSLGDESLSNSEEVKTELLGQDNSKKEPSQDVDPVDSYFN